MNPLESRIHADAESAASEITPADIPPLRLRRQTFSSAGSGRLRMTGAPGRRGSRRWLVPLAAAASVVIVVAAVETVGQAQNGGHPNPGPAASGPAAPRVSPAQAALATEALDDYLPATGAQYTAGLAYEWTRLKISAHVFGSCMAGAGFPQPPFTESERAYLDSFPANSQFPDLAQRATDGNMTGQTYISQQPVIPDSAAAHTAVSHCTAVSDQPFARIDQVAAPLQNQWIDIYTAIESSSTVSATQPAFAACLEEHGIPASYAAQSGGGSSLFGGFFGWMDTLGQEATSTSELNTENQHWTSVFVQCAGPAVSVLERLQLSQRSSFFAQHAQQITEIKTLAMRLLDQSPTATGQAASRDRHS